jgi:acyl carrier protein
MMAADIVLVVAAFLEETFLFSFSGDNVSDDENLFERGYIDSYGLVQLIAFLEATFSIAILDEDMASPELASLSGIVSFTKERLSRGR